MTMGITQPRSEPRWTAWENSVKEPSSSISLTDTRGPEYLMDRMGDCFEAADRLFVMGIYAAGEEPIPGVDSRGLVDRIRQSREATFVEGPSAMVRILERETEPGDLVVTMGAGNVWKVGEEFLG